MFSKFQKVNQRNHVIDIMVITGQKPVHSKIKNVITVKLKDTPLKFVKKNKNKQKVMHTQLIKYPMLHHLKANAM